MIGPAAILGSSFNAWSVAGTLKPATHAVTRQKVTLAPMTNAGNSARCQIQTINSHDQPAGDAEQERGENFPPKRAQIPAQRRLVRAQRLNRHGHGLDAHAFAEAENHREKKRDDEAFFQRQFVKSGQNCAQRPAENRREQPRKPDAKRAPRRGVAHLRDVKAERLEHFRQSARARRCRKLPP